MIERSLAPQTGIPKVPRLVLATNCDLQVIGGQEISINTMLTYPAEWTVVSPIPQGELPGINVVRTRKDLRIPRKGSVLSPFEIRRINHVLHEIDPQAIIIDGGVAFPPSFYVGLSRDLKARTHVMWRYKVGDPVLDRDIPRFERMERAVHKIGLRPFVKRVNSNLAVSQTVAESLLALGAPEDNIRIVPEHLGNEFNPRDRVHDRSLSYENTNRSQYLEQDELGILYVGRITRPKGIDEIVDLYDILRRERKKLLQTDGSFRKVKITVVGPVRENDQAFYAGIRERQRQTEAATNTEHAADSVSLEFVGPKSHEELQDIYNAYDVLLASSPSEGYGRVLIEAMMGGMTVLGKLQAAATKDIINSAPYPIGILYDSPKAAAGEILHMMQHPEQLADLQAKALTWGNSHYSLEESRRGLWQALEI